MFLKITIFFLISFPLYAVENEVKMTETKGSRGDPRLRGPRSHPTQEQQVVEKVTTPSDNREESAIRPDPVVG